MSNELIRCAILWGEMWHEALEQAYRRYFYYEQHGIDSMLGAPLTFTVTLPLHLPLHCSVRLCSERGECEGGARV